MKKRTKVLYVIGIAFCALSIVGLILSGQISIYVGMPLFLVFAAMGYISVRYVVKAQEVAKILYADYVNSLYLKIEKIKLQNKLNEAKAENKAVFEKYFKLFDKVAIDKDLVYNAEKTADAYRLNFCKMRKKAKAYKDGYNSLIDVINSLIDENVKVRMDSYKPVTSKDETIGYQCLHCGRMFKIKAVHKCKGTYRKKGLSFKEIH